MIDDTLGSQNCAFVFVAKAPGPELYKRIDSRGSRCFRITFAFNCSKMADFRSASQKRACVGSGAPVTFVRVTLYDKRGSPVSTH
jgi:hypothetical protein